MQSHDFLCSLFSNIARSRSSSAVLVLVPSPDCLCLSRHQHFKESIGMGGASSKYTVGGDASYSTIEAALADGKSKEEIHVFLAAASRDLVPSNNKQLSDRLDMLKILVDRAGFACPALPVAGWFTGVQSMIELKVTEIQFLGL